MSEGKSETYWLSWRMIVQAYAFGAFVLNGKGKGTLVHVHSMNTHRRSKNIAALILNLHTKWS